MRIATGYACDDCGSLMVEDVELDALGAVLWAAQREHICLMCCFGVPADIGLIKGALSAGRAALVSQGGAQ